MDFVTFINKQAKDQNMNGSANYRIFCLMTLHQTNNYLSSLLSD
jgi:hypothetical protein